MKYNVICTIDGEVGILVCSARTYIEAMNAARVIIDNDVRSDCWNEYKNEGVIRAWKNIGNHIKKLFIIKECPC